LQPFDLLLISLAVWYTAYALIKLSAPFNVLGKLRTWAQAGENAKAGSLGELLTCIYCTAWYCAIFWFIVWQTPLKPIVYPFALAGAALMLHRYTGSFHT